MRRRSAGISCSSCWRGGTPRRAPHCSSPDRSHELRYAFEHGQGTAVELFGLTPIRWSGDKQAITAALEEVSEAKAHVFTLAMIIGAIEGRLSTYGWRRVHACTVAYFAFLVDQGYPLSEVEQVAIGQDALPGTTDE